MSSLNCQNSFFRLVSYLLRPLSVKIISQSSVPQCPSNNWAWNETWVTEWPLQNFLWELQQNLNLAAQLPTYCFLHFLHVIEWITFSQLQSRWRPSIILYVLLPFLLVKAFFCSRKTQTSQLFPWQPQDFPSVCFSTGTFALTKKYLKHFPLIKPTMDTSEETLLCFASGVKNKLTFDEMFLLLEKVGW